MAAIDGQPLGADELRFWLRHVGRNSERVHGAPGAAALSGPQGAALRATLIDEALQSACQARAVEALAHEHGVALTADDQAEIARRQAKDLAVYGGVGEYRRVLDETYGSPAIYARLQRIDRLGDHLFVALYGADGRGCSDRCVADFVADQGLVRVKYVFFARRTDDGRPLSPAELAADRATLGRDAQTLRASPDRIDAVIARDTPTEVAEHPDGRLLAPGAREEEFDTAVRELAPGQTSGVVETPAGLYVVERLSVPPDIALASAGRTLRYWAAYEHLFEPAVAARCARMSVVRSPALSAVDVASALDEGGR